MMFCTLRRRFVIAAAAIVLATTAIAPAALAESKVPAPIIAVVDIQTILRDAKAAQGVRAERDRFAQSYQSEFAAKEKSLRDSDQELMRQRSILSPEAFAEKRRAFEQNVAQFQRDVQGRRRALERSYGQAMTQVQAALIKVADEIAQEVGANMVLTKSQVFLLDPKMDITATALERLNGRLSTVAFPEPQVEAGQQPATPPAKATSKKK